MVDGVLCGAMITISKICRGQSYSWISSPTRLDPWEIVYTRGVHKASVGNIQSKIPTETMRSLLACLICVYLRDFLGITLLQGIEKKKGSIKADLGDCVFQIQKLFCMRDTTRLGLKLNAYTGSPLDYHDT